ncbi:molybdopterin oxidoreductase family protein [Leptolyngbya sp. NK1-12]|uniref:Molybdopterin oxidoreductase family protein n=1 Tax=Leptolyngbya sp. NK1-12 TaxID=2547451 RepID=A0AA96WFA8_9CYAN|nr:molybdopterin oxidoreductase family protein [Leptolyngbya sp. NK1-12]WNZ24133.1 molybdopterin oxidoreductase family protein [Leptolyngbya sp. NK1-12]
MTETAETLDNTISAGKTVIKGACPHDCPDTCAMLTTVQDGSAISVSGNADYPYTKGTLCGKVDKYLHRVYSPDRILYPLRQVGPKGCGRFQQISWDEALDEIAERFESIIADYGSEAILSCNYLGQQGILNGIASGDAFFNRLGASVSERTLCNSGTRTAYFMTFGATPGTDPEQFIHAKYIILWACNAISTNLHLWPIISEARKQGAKLVVIDPFQTRTAKQADWHISVRPGTDGALALGMMHVIIQQDLIDTDYVEKYTIGYEQLKARAREFPPERVAKITGVSVEDIIRLAQEYATAQPAVIRIGVALERQAGGGQAVRAICCLPALVGAWRHLGGGFLQVTNWAFPIQWNAIQRPDFIKPGTRVINLWQLGAALTGELELNPPIKSLFVYNCNPLVMIAEQEKIVAGLQRDDLFTIVSEQFMTDTADFADIVLPATTQIEQFDLMYSWGQLYLTANLPAIPPIGAAIPNAKLFRKLAARMGFEEEHFKLTDEELIQKAIDWSSPTLQGVDLELIKQQGFVKLHIDPTPHAAGNFATPSGKCEFFSSKALQGNFVMPFLRQGYTEMQSGEPLDPLPNYTPLRESCPSDPERASRYPLNLISAKSHAFINSCYGNLPKHKRMEGAPRVFIHPEDAAHRSIEHGQLVKVFNDRGAFEVIAHVGNEVQPGVVVASLGHWRKLSHSNSSLNAVASSVFADLGRAAAVSDTLVEVILARRNC